jgi:hypothetical protein
MYTETTSKKLDKNKSPGNVDIHVHRTYLLEMKIKQIKLVCMN